MEETVRKFLTEQEKNYYIEALTPELPILRVKAEVSQEEISNAIGISRQTYGAIERKVRKMSWNTYLSLILFFDYNRKTHSTLRRTAGFPHEIIKRFNDGDEPHDLELGLLFQADEKNIIASLDDQALATMKTILMVEYSRCNNITGDAVVKLFEGVDIMAKGPSKEQVTTTKALKTIKRKN